MMFDPIEEWHFDPYVRDDLPMFNKPVWILMEDNCIPKYPYLMLAIRIESNQTMIDFEDKWLRINENFNYGDIPTFTDCYENYLSPNEISIIAWRYLKDNETSDE